MTVHDFQTSLNAIKDAEPLCDATWRSFFGNRLRHVERNHGDNPNQRKGTDAVVILRGGVVVRVEEKVRPLKDYGDVLFEVWSNFERRTPGWSCKDLSCEYLAFVHAQSKRSVVYPWQSYRRVLGMHGVEWLNRAEREVHGYRRIEAKNSGYTTVSLIVPFAVVQAAGAGGVEIALAEAA